MEEKINIVEFLKDCPRGMELDCSLYENLEFDHIDKDNGAYPIICRVKTEWDSYNIYAFTEYGCYGEEKYSKCVIFPKGKNSWEGFQRPFKDGDVISLIINKNLWYGIYQKEFNNKLYCHVSYSTATESIYTKSNISGTCSINSISVARLATEEEKQTFFNIIKDNGYKWNEKTKTLEELIKPKKFKDGDIITCSNSACSFVSIFKEMNTGITFRRYVSLILDYGQQFRAQEGSADFKNPRFATEEEKQKLFDVIKANGYKWNEETKTLEKLIIPRFKVGDRIKSIYNHSQYDIKEITDTHYTFVGVECKFNYIVPIIEDKNYELVSNKFDITTLKPFDKVLVRNTNEQVWVVDFFSHKDKKQYNHNTGIELEGYNFVCVGHYSYQCIPYDGNEHLCGTKNDCSEFYKTWE